MRSFHAGFFWLCVVGAASVGPLEARAQDNVMRNGVVIADSRSCFTTSTPGTYLRFYARNQSVVAHVLRVVSVALLRPSGPPLPMPVAEVTADDAPVAGALTLEPGAGPLVVVWLDDPTMALAAIHDEAVYRVRVTIDGAPAELTVRVPHAIRERVRKP